MVKSFIPGPVRQMHKEGKDKVSHKHLHFKIYITTMFTLDKYNIKIKYFIEFKIKNTSDKKILQFISD